MTTDLKIEGMTCEHCARAVRGALEGVPGVSRAEVNLLRGHASVEHEASVSVDAMAEAVDKEGYTARG